MEVEFYEALTGLQFKMAVNPTDTVLRIKLNIEEHHSISVANQTLRFNGVTLHDGHVINPATDTPIELIVVDYPDEDDDPKPDPDDVAPPPPQQGSRVRIKIIPPRGNNPPARSSLGRERSTYLRPSRSGSASNAEARNLMPPPRPVEPESDSDDDDGDQDDIMYGC